MNLNREPYLPYLLSHRHLKLTLTSHVSVVTDSPPSFPVPPKALAKEKKSKPIAARQTPASPSRSSTPPVTLAPPLLSSSPTADAAASKNPKKTRQLLVRSERLETDFSVEGKVNAFDVLVGATKSVMTEAR